ncbi:unnamed protein product [Clonostachys chloroleuca]|uniref:Uncharacterized protein n=1 Tax=Clonostachys chloroleuca TaxID=1926264 RepID=A0AA35QG91_9HYPO|nr:unnamed protein product [Clonostachys chloroleuca]
MAVDVNNSVPDHQPQNKLASFTQDEESLLTTPVMAFVVVRALFASSSNPHQEVVREDRQVKLKSTQCKRFCNPTVCGELQV